ncbi:MAG: hypothetical protein U9Q66_02150 [Patescibacteria group bacterium]|nr:hypothetical protein [Patescibacteria group bacterium]
MKLISLLLIFLIFSINISFAEDKDFSYTDYEKNTEDICKAQYLTKDKIKKIFIKKDIKYKEVKKIFL